MSDGESLDLAEGSGALVFELGVEEIAAADGGDVEACLLRLLSVCDSFVSFFLSLVVCFDFERIGVVRAMVEE